MNLDDVIDWEQVSCLRDKTKDEIFELVITGKIDWIAAEYVFFSREDRVNAREVFSLGNNIFKKECYSRNFKIVDFHKGMSPPEYMREEVLARELDKNKSIVPLTGREGYHDSERNGYRDSRRGAAIFDRTVNRNRHIIRKPLL